MLHRTRLAPSPTGALHLGNVRTFLLTWALARQSGWEIVLRIEDLDGPRIKSGAARDAIETLRWLGMDWDEGPYFQSADLEPYHAALRRLADAGSIYPCRCTRAEIQRASLSAPHSDEHELCYPGTCRPAPDALRAIDPTEDPDSGWRILVSDEVHRFQDQFAGEHAWNLRTHVGDFLVATKGGYPSYQLAVVVDDARQNIDRIVRGDDLLSSVARQEWIYRCLGLTSSREYWHIPLVVGPDGRRLAKRHGDTRVESYRRRGATPRRIIGLMASWCGLVPRDEPCTMSIEEFLQEWDYQKLPREAIVFGPQDDAWLTAD